MKIIDEREISKNPKKTKTEKNKGGGGGGVWGVGGGGGGCRSYGEEVEAN